MKKLLIEIIVCFILIIPFITPCLADSENSNGRVWKEDFNLIPEQEKPVIPKGWVLKRKLGTKPSAFSVLKDEKEDSSYLHMTADKASASLIYNLKEVNLTKTPVLRWRWRVTTLPEGGDGRISDKDDQAIGIYIGTGSFLNKKSISYRWDTDTPKGSEGNCTYGAGTIKIKWVTLRNKEDAAKSQWFIEERNLAEDFKKTWGFYPEKIYLSISCNSQYTGTKAAGDIDWIEFITASDKYGENILQDKK